MIKPLRQAFRYFFRRSRHDDELRREMEFHLAMETAERERRGESAAEARRLARAEFGATAAVREHVHDTRGFTFWEHLVQDLRFGIRLLVAQPGFTFVAVLVLALGIGANTAVFSFVNVALLKPLPGHAKGEMLGVYSKDMAHPNTFRAFSYPDYVDLATHTDVFASLAAHTMAMTGVRNGDVTRRVFSGIVTAGFFDLFGAPPMIGRAFTHEEELPGANVPVVILSYPTWQRLGGTPDVVGRSLRVNERDFQIVGVAPKGFGGPIAVMTPEFWVPTGIYDTITNDFVRDGLTTSLGDRRHYNLMLLARLQPAVTSAAVAPKLQIISAHMASAFPADNKDHQIVLAPLSRIAMSTSPVDDTGPASAMVVLMSMAVIVLLVASCNLANMLLARGGARRKEFAIRLALGGSRGRLVRQLLTEGFILAIAAGAVGVLLSIWSTRLLFATLAPLSPITFSYDATPDWRVFAATLGYCSLSTIVFCLLPARALARTDPSPALKDHAGEIAGTGRSRRALSQGLVMSQLALSLVLISMAALFMRGAVEAAKADPGFSFDRGVMLQIDPSLSGADAARSRMLQLTALERLRQRPDVASAGIASIMPFAEIRTAVNVQLPGARIHRGDANHAGLIESTLTAVSGQYFDALDRPLVAGRDFTQAEESSAAGPRVAIIDEPLARALFGAANPIGRQIQYAPREESADPILVDVVGVAPGFRDTLFDIEPKPHVYFPIGQEFQSGVYLHVRTKAPSAEAEGALLPSFRRTLNDVDARLPVLAVETRAMFRDRNLLLAVVRMGAVVFTLFGAIALFLAAVGIYGVKAYVVSRRTREIGIRIALGASPRGVIWMVVREGLAASLAGLAIGLVLSALAGVVMRNLTYQGRAADAAVLSIALAVLTGSALLASWLPARRATRVTAIEALRR